MPQTISKVKDDFEEINQFISFRVADAELQPSSVRGGEDLIKSMIKGGWHLYIEIES